MKEPVDRPGEEIESLNPAWMSFDLDAVSVEELEQRFELALALQIELGKFCGCPNLKTCGVFCSPPPA
jgi:hypothetical protein